MDPVERIDKATAHTSKIVNGVSTDQLSQPTPCTEFDVRALLNHMLGGLEMLRTAASGGKAVPPEGDQFGPNPGHDYDERRAKLLDVVRGEGALDRNWEMSFGSIPGSIMAGIAFMEHLTHGWDLAKATGQDTSIPDDLVEECLAVVTPMENMLRSPGVCGPRVDVPAGAPRLDQLIGFMGRQP
jgi:uncharacterized protein (TIGR03086 family)